MTSAFSSSESSCLEREAEIDVCPETKNQLWNDINKQESTDWILQNDYKMVCLQFPDNYLPFSNAIVESLKSSLKLCNRLAGRKLFILGDTSYGSCCVDEIAAEHVEADSIIHFGNACCSKVSRLPVLYIFPHLPIDLLQFYENVILLADVCRNKELFIYLDIGYHYLLKSSLKDGNTEFIAKLREKLQCKDLHINVYPNGGESLVQSKFSEDIISIFVGGDNKNFFNLSITSKGSKWFVFEPSHNTLLEKNPLTANYIRRRYYHIEKCKDAAVIGIVLATLTAEGYLDVVERLEEMAESRYIKTQMISVGRINQAKLANFLEIDCFVLIGCPFNTLYTSKDFYKPIISVFEAEMALNPAWYMKYPDTYVTDFRQLLPNGSSFLPFVPNDDINSEEHDVSLVSGRVRYGNTNAMEASTTNNNGLSEQERALLAPSKMEVMTSNVGLTFEDRTWKGLDPALGCTEPAKIQKGLSGIPIEYSQDDLQQI